MSLEGFFLLKRSYPLPDSSTLTDYKLCDFSISSKEATRLIKILDSTKVTGLDKIPVIIFKNRSTLTPTLVKLFNRCLKEKCLWNVSAACPVFKNIDEHSFPLKYLIIINVYYKKWLLIISTDTTFWSTKMAFRCTMGLHTVSAKHFIIKSSRER